MPIEAARYCIPFLAGLLSFIAYLVVEKDSSITNSFVHAALIVLDIVAAIYTLCVGAIVSSKHRNEEKTNN